MELRLPRLEEAVLIVRLNRFAATVIWRGETVLCHVPNTGRMREFMVPGARLAVAPSPDDGRVTRCKLVLVMYKGEWVAIESSLANAMIEGLLRSGEAAGLNKLQDIKREVWLGESRLDISFLRGGWKTWMEVKCCTLVEEGVARFPDAPTLRGVKHLKELISASQQGDGAVIVFLVTRRADRFEPNARMDPLFAKTLRLARDSGVEIRAFACHVDLERIKWDKEIPCTIEEEWE